MKKILMTMVAAFAAVSMNAQYYVGGEIGFASSKAAVAGAETQTSFKIMPEFGYVLDETMSVGIMLGYEQGDAAGAFNTSAKSFAIGEGIQGVNDKATSYVINPYLRYNMMKFGNVSLFGDASVLYRHSERDLGVLGKDKYNEFGIGVKPGIAVALNDKISFVSHLGFLGYVQGKQDVDGAEAASAFGFDFANNLTFGLYYNF